MMDLPLNKVLLGDCLEVLKTLPDSSVDAIVCDPPYGLGTKQPSRDDIIKYLQGGRLDTAGDFMGKNWAIPPISVWAECFRVLKPGGHLLSFAGTRTFDMMSVGIRAAGFEDRDTVASMFGPCLAWIYGAGFPKSLDIAKAIDKMAGAKREVVGPSQRHGGGESSKYAQDEWTRQNAATMGSVVTAPATDDAKKWQGWGTALKPAWEPVLCFRKPPEQPLTRNILENGVGGLNIEGCRVGTKGVPVGRWPANLALTHASACVQLPDETWECAEGCPVKLLNEQSGDRPSTGPYPSDAQAESHYRPEQGAYQKQGPVYDDEGGASRFFPNFTPPDAPFYYTAKASRQDRNDGLDPGETGAYEPGKYSLRDDVTDENFQEVVAAFKSQGVETFSERETFPLVTDKQVPNSVRKYFRQAHKGERGNTHVTVKPVALMRWLVRLVCPKGGVVLDPYTGSGTTLVAAAEEGMDFVGIELDPAYHKIAAKRATAIATKRQIKETEAYIFDMMMNGDV